MRKLSKGEKIFSVFNYIILTMAALVCILPMIHVLAISLSSRSAVAAGVVKLWPVDFTIMSYKYVINKPEFFRSLLVSVKRVTLGLLVNMFLTIITAYPLSKDDRQLPYRTVLVWFFVFTMLFGGGLIPFYMTVRFTGLIDTIWALIIPGAVPVYHVILLLNFFRNLPKELEEAALVDGASHWTILWKIYVPLSLPALATLTLFTAVGHWNSWFDGLIFMNRPENYPLQSYLQTIVVQQTINPGSILSTEDWKLLQIVSDRTVKTAQIFLGALPILIVYPFLQKYFMRGIVLGSLKE